MILVLNKPKLKCLSYPASVRMEYKYLCVKQIQLKEEIILFMKHSRALINNICICFRQLWDLKPKSIRSLGKHPRIGNNLISAITDRQGHKCNQISRLLKAFGFLIIFKNAQ